MSAPFRSTSPLPVAIGLALGIALAALLPSVSSPLRLALAVAAVGTGLRPQWLLLAAFLAGLALGSAPPVSAPDGVTVDDRTLDRVTGTVAGPVITTAHGTGALITPRGERAAIWVWSEQPLVPGQTVIVVGRARTPTQARGPGVPRRHGPQVELNAESVTVVADDPDLAARAWRWASGVQAAGVRTIDEASGDPAARAALRGIALGDRSGIPPELDARFRATGIFHVLSVSGLHLAVVAGLVFWILRRLVAASPLGARTQPARWAAPPALVFAIAYTMITGAQLATLRAMLVIALMLVGAMLDRPVRLVDALGVAAIVLLGWRPQDVFDPSFQLSFTAALTLALIPVAPLPLRGVRGWLVRGLVTSTWVVLTTAPLTAYHFQQITPGGIVGNLLLTPPLELLALPLALAGIALGPLGEPLIRLAILLVELVDRAASLGSDVAIVGRVAIASPIVVGILVALSLALVRARSSPLRVAAWSVLCLLWASARSPAPPESVRVTFLDVGQGDAALVELPDGGAWLIDAGGNASARDLARASHPGETIERTLAAFGIPRIDLAILSHPHPDHYLGLAALRTPITELWTAADPEAEPFSPSAPSAVPSLSTLLHHLAARGTRMVHPALGSVLERAGVELRVWAPRYVAYAGATEVAAVDPVRSVNDNSLVIELRYRGRSILFAGDVEHEGEELVVDAGVPHVDVVKVAHHGSPTSSSPAFVAATSPTLAVISCGRGNTFGFPSADVLLRWHSVGAEVARTDTDGAISVVIDASGALSVDRFVRSAP